MTAIVILAAGLSSRMGKPKQNLIYQNQTLLQRAIKHAQLATDNVLVVLGANVDEIKPTINDLQIDLLINKDWTEGMASSVRLAVQQVQKCYPEVDQLIFILCDQPYLSAGLLLQLQQTAAESTNGIIACSYNDTIGVPVLFKYRYFPALLLLNGEHGARKLINYYADDVKTVPFPGGETDIDTEADFQKLIDGHA